MGEYTEIELASQEFWIKVVDMLQQNWALVEDNIINNGVTIYFIGDNSGVFDTRDYRSQKAAESDLIRNGFQHIGDLDTEFKEYVSPPKPPYYWKDHPNGRIYSSGRFWRS